MNDDIELQLHPGEAPPSADAAAPEPEAHGVVVWRVPQQALAALAKRYRREVVRLRKRVAEARRVFIESQRSGLNVTESLTLLREVEADLDWCERAIVALDALEAEGTVYRR